MADIDEIGLFVGAFVSAWLKMVRLDCPCRPAEEARISRVLRFVRHVVCVFVIGFGLVSGRFVEIGRIVQTTTK